MSTRISLHPASALIGAVALGLALLLASAASHSPDRPIEVYGIPKAANIVRLTAADLPYTVPANKSLVITAWAPRAYPSVTLALLIDGLDVAYAHTGDPSWGSQGQPRTFVPGIVALPGSVVTNAIPTPYGDGVILGYLAPQ